MISIYEPFLELYKKSANNAIESGWISNHGIYIEKATQKLSEVLNVKHTILMSNGTVATHCMFKSLKFKHPDINKIYVPNNVYIAAWNTVLMEYPETSLEVLPIDIETWNMNENEDLIKSLDLNSALLIVHNLGNIVNIQRIKNIRPDIVIIEDNCEGVFGEYNNIKSGCSVDSLCSAISFYGNKTITTGEGGAFITNDTDVYNYIKKVYSQGMSNERYKHEVHAYNYRMTNIQAGFLYDQLCDIDNILLRKQKLFENYNLLLNQLIDSGDIILQKCNNKTKRANWMYAIRIKGNKLSTNDTFEFMKSKGVETRPFFYSYQHHNHLKNLKIHNKINLQESEILNREILMIPSSPMITFEQQNKVVESLKELIRIINE